MKRACDCCIRRKVKCDGRQPCHRCVLAKPRVLCTYLRPAQKRGPKAWKVPTTSRRGTGTTNSIECQRSPSSGVEEGQTHVHHSEDDGNVELSPLSFCTDDSSRISTSVCSSDSSGSPMRIPVSVIISLFEIYRLRMYPVWPVLDVDIVLSQVRDTNSGPDVYVLATALCAATAAQLDLDPIDHENSHITSQDLEMECNRLRSLCDYREHPNTDQVLASFFLHVYHAKRDRQKAAFLYLQEAISLDRLLQNGFNCGSSNSDDLTSSESTQVLSLLLWVSERGYAIQHGLPISLQGDISPPSTTGLRGTNIYVKGLLNLAGLFVAFEASSVPRFSRYGEFSISSQKLVAIDKALADTSPQLSNFNVVQRADFLVTKQWMRILLWQQALRRGLLSSASYDAAMNFNFPAQVVRDLLTWMALFSTDNLVPLGRDQLVKSFEVANTLADVILCKPQLSETGYRRMGPSEFLHCLYQTISPFLEKEPSLNLMLRQKTAEILLNTPSRLWVLDSDLLHEDDMYPENVAMEPPEIDHGQFTGTIPQCGEDENLLTDYIASCSREITAEQLLDLNVTRAC